MKESIMIQQSAPELEPTEPTAPAIEPDVEPAESDADDEPDAEPAEPTAPDADDEPAAEPAADVEPELELDELEARVLSRRGRWDATPADERCAVSPCPRPPAQLGLCAGHYASQRGAHV